jgi:hypothetical protein
MRQTGTCTARAAVDGFLFSPRCAKPNTRRAYAGALDRVVDEIGADLAQGNDQQLAAALHRVWGHRAPSTWNRNRAAVATWLSWWARAGRVCRPCPRRANGGANTPTPAGH